MTGKSYLDMAEAEQDASEAKPQATANAGELDLSGVSPTPVQRPAELQVAVDEGRRRGFGAADGAEPAARRPRAPPQKRAAKAAPAPKRVIVTLADVPPAGANGQIALTGDAQVIYAFIRRAHFERRPRGDLLADMMRLYEASHGPVPDDY